MIPKYIAYFPAVLTIAEYLAGARGFFCAISLAFSAKYKGLEIIRTMIPNTIKQIPMINGDIV